MAQIFDRRVRTLEHVRDMNFYLLIWCPNENKKKRENNISKQTNFKLIYSEQQKI